MAQHEELSEVELNRRMRLSGVPRIYANREASLSKCGSAGEQALAWLKAGGYQTLKAGAAVVEIVSETVEASAAFYCMARNCVLHRIPVRVLHVRELLHGDHLSDDAWELIEDADALFVEALVPDREGDLNDPQRAVLEWFLARWVMGGKALVVLSVGQISQSTLSNRFKSRMREHLKFVIQNA